MKTFSDTLRRANQPPAILRYAVALSLSGAALATAFLIPSLRDQASFSILFLAVLASAAFGGLGPGLVATALCAGGLLYRLVVAGRTSALDFLPLLAFVLASVLLTLWSESRRRAIASANLRASADIMPAAIFVHDESRIRYVNRVTREVTGYSAKELVGRDLSDFVDAEFRNAVREQSMGVLRGEAVPARHEFKVITRAGEARWLDCTSTPTEFEGRRCILSSAFDVTARRRAEEVLKRQVQLLDLAFEPILVRDATDRIIYWNQGAERLYGWTRQQALGQYAHALLNTTFPKPLQEIEQELAQKGHWSGEVLHTAKDGRKIVVTSLWTLNAVPGEASVILETNFDTTERKRAEETLRMAERLAAASRMAATVAHEINNPLEAVTNCLYLVHQEQERARDLLNTAERELERVAHITKQTLAFYRDNGTPVPVDVRTLVGEVLEVCVAMLAAKSIKVHRQYRDIPEILGYPNEIRQVILNVIANSIESGGSNITVRISRGHDRIDSQREGLRITIADDGCGITPEHRKQLFRPFFTTKQGTGTGLGLWVTRGIVQKLEGTIRLRSSRVPARSGTCVSIFFPSGTQVVTQLNKAAAGLQSAA